MKKLLTIAMLLSLICTTALAELDVKSMTDEELRATITACAAELNSRRATDKGTLLFQAENLSVYQTGEAYIDKYGRLEVPITMYSSYDVVVSPSPVFAAVNGFTVQAYGLTNIAPQTAMIGKLDFATESLSLNAIEDVYQVVFQWQVYSPGNGVLLLTEERYEYTF